MRRKDREMSKDFAMEVLRDCEYAVIATVNPDGTPYCVPVSPALVGETLYFHCATSGKKLDNIFHNQSICVTAVRHTKLVPEKYTTEYESSVAAGTCEIVDNDEEKIAALRAIVEKYAASNLEAFENAIATSLKRTGVCKINILHITGKANIK